MSVRVISTGVARHLDSFTGDAEVTDWARVTTSISDGSRGASSSPLKTDVSISTVAIVGGDVNVGLELRQGVRTCGSLVVIEGGVSCTSHGGKGTPFSSFARNAVVIIRVSCGRSPGTIGARESVYSTFWAVTHLRTEIRVGDSLASFSVGVVSRKHLCRLLGLTFELAVVSIITGGALACQGEAGG